MDPNPETFAWGKVAGATCAVLPHYAASTLVTTVSKTTQCCGYDWEYQE